MLERRHHTAIDLGLERSEAVWQRMGAPRPARTVITVAGTNGKGSTVATLVSLLESLGYRTGHYTTPHLFRYNERICIRLQAISDEEIVAAFELVEKARGDSPLSYFEFGTLAALQTLSQADLDFAILEVGLGGRLDAVNIIDADCAVITAIGIDHQEFLGDNREKIGWEKAGILRQGIKAIISDEDPPRSVLDHAKQLDCDTWRLGHEYSASIIKGKFHLRFKGRNLTIEPPVLNGEHQLRNAAGALAAVVSLLPHALDDANRLNEGLQNVQISNRMQRVSDDPLIWVDVGHNPLAAQALAERLKDRSVYCVIGMLRDKDAAEVARILAEVVDRWYVGSLQGDRGQSGNDLKAQLAFGAPESTFLVFDSIACALAQACADCSSNNAILVFGSFFTASEAMLHLRDAARIPPV